jgi:hypothetical protein
MYRVSLLSWQNGMRRNSCVEQIPNLDFFEKIKYFQACSHYF